MSYQPPSGQLPINLPIGGLPSPVGGVDVQTLTSPVTIVAAISFVTLISFVVMYLRSRGRRSGPLSSKVLKGKGDCYAVMLDLGSNELFFTPLTRVSQHRYVFPYKKTQYMFIPVDGRPFIVRGVDKPVFLGVLAGGMGMEINPELFFASGITKVVASELSADLDSEDPEILKKLILKISGERSTYQGKLPTISGIAFEVNPSKLVLALLKNHIMNTSATFNALTESWESIEAVSKMRRTQPSEYGRMVVYMAIAGIIIVIALMIAKVAGVI